jgi:hypothetical protein
MRHLCRATVAEMRGRVAGLTCDTTCANTTWVGITCRVMSVPREPVGNTVDLAMSHRRAPSLKSRRKRGWR